MLARFRNWRSACLPALWMLAFPLLSGQERKPSKALYEYIEQARQAGLAEAQIRKDALRAGWDRTTVEETYAIVLQLNGERAAPAGGLRAPTVVGEDYRIGAGDVLQVMVWREPDASVPAAVVRADGKISAPLVAEVDAAGYTPAELEIILAQRLSKFLANPVVTVVAREINSKKVYVVGQVTREGPIVLNRPMRVLQALNEAGGLTEFARKKKIYVLRTVNGRETKLLFDYDSVIQGGRLDQNISLLPDDTIVVP